MSKDVQLAPIQLAREYGQLSGSASSAMGSRVQHAAVDRTHMADDITAMLASILAPSLPAVNPSSSASFTPFPSMSSLSLPSSLAVWFPGGQPYQPWQHRQAAATEQHIAFRCHLHRLLQRAQVPRLEWPELTHKPSCGMSKNSFTGECYQHAFVALHLSILMQLTRM